MRHIIASAAPVQSAPYWSGERLVCDLEFVDQNLDPVKVTLPFFVGLTPSNDVIAAHWPELMKEAS